MSTAFTVLDVSHKGTDLRGAWAAQSVECLTTAQVVILRFVRLSPTSGSVPAAPSPEPASDSVSPSLSAPPLLVLCLCLLNLVMVQAASNILNSFKLLRMAKTCQCPKGEDLHQHLNYSG